MSAFRFLHAADIHLDSPLHGLSRYDGIPREDVRGATRAAFDNLVNRALAEAPRHESGGSVRHLRTYGDHATRMDASRRSGLRSALSVGVQM
jgi:hypothetical protein